MFLQPVKLLHLLFSPRSFSRERRACSTFPVSRATQTIVSAWAPAAVARIRARNSAARWAPPPRSRCGARRRRLRGSCAAPPTRPEAAPAAWSPATSASRRSSCACSPASPSSSPACCSTSSWSEGIYNDRIEGETKITKRKNKHVYGWTNTRCTSTALYGFISSVFFLCVSN